MSYKTIQPTTFLKPYVNYYWFLRIEEKDLPLNQDLLPYCWFELFFNLNSNSCIKSQLVGQLSSASIINYVSPFRAVGVRFQPWVGNIITGIPANELAGQSVNWSEIETLAPFLEEKLRDAEDEASIIALLEQFILQRITSGELDKASASICRYFLQEMQGITIDKAIAGIGLGRRRIEQKFLETTGVTMQKFIRKSRFDLTIDLLNENHKQSLTEIGAKAGYFDQSHFIREFKSFASYTPKSYVKKLSNMSALERSLQV